MPTAPENLSGRNSAHDVLHRDARDRVPLSHLPQSPTQLNVERLPALAKWDDMQLACREDPTANGQLEYLLREPIAVGFVAAGLFWIAVMIAATAIDVRHALGILAVVFTVQTASGILVQRQTPLRVLFRALILPVAMLISVLATALLLEFRIPVLIVLATMLFGLIHRLGAGPLRFFTEWLLAHPRLRPESRANVAVPTLQPDRMVLLAFIAIALLLPRYSATAAIAATIVLCGVICARERFGLALLPRLQRVWGVYAAYPDATEVAPGAWVPRPSARKRSLHIYAYSIAFYLFFTAAHSFFLPWDLFFDHFHRLHLYYGPEGPPVKGWEAVLASRQHFWEEIVARPETWSYLAARDFIRSFGASSAFFALAGAIAALLPVWMLLAVYRRPLLQIERFEEELEQVDADGRAEWQWYLDRIANSPHEATDPLTGEPVRERDHLFLGIEPLYHYPVLLDRNILNEHAYIVGETGSGKTSLGIMPLLMQLLRMPVSTKDDGAPHPIVVIDLKGDPALFHTVRHEAHARRQALGITDSNDPRGAFKFFTSETGQPSYRFNPFNSLTSDTRSDMQICQLLLESLSLSHGEGYGRSYYSRKNRYLLYEALNRQPAPRTFLELYGHLNQLAHANPDLKRDTFELVSTIHALTLYDQLATSPTQAQTQRAIHMPTALEHGQVIYFWLPAAVETISVREIAKLALYCLVSAAIDRQTNGLPIHQAYVVIDEFQRIAAENFKIILEQARSFGLAAILANQTQSDLQLANVDLRPTVRTNTRFKQVFGVSDPGEIRDLISVAGEEISCLYSWTTPAAAWEYGQIVRPRDAFETKTHQEVIRPRLGINDILAVSDHPLDSLMLVSRGAGYTQFGGTPVLLRSTWPMHQDEYERRKREPWPEPPEDDADDTVVPEKSPQEIEHTADVEKQRQIDEALTDLFANLPQLGAGDA